MTDALVEAVEKLLCYANPRAMSTVQSADPETYVAAFPSICSFVMEWETGNTQDKQGIEYAQLIWMPIVGSLRKHPEVITQDFVETAVKLIQHWCKQTDENTKSLQVYQKTVLQYVITLFQSLDNTHTGLVSMFTKGIVECLFVNDKDIRELAANILSCKGDLPPECVPRIFSRLRESSHPPVEALGAMSPGSFKQCKERILSNVDILVKHGLAQQNHKIMMLLQAIVNERPHSLIPFMKEIINYMKLNPSDHWIWQLLCVISATQPEATKDYLDHILIAADEVPQLTYPILQCLGYTGTEDARCARRVLTFLVNKIENTWDPAQLLMLIRQVVNISEWQPEASQSYLPSIKSMEKHRDWDIRELVKTANV